ncbi:MULTISPECIES: UMP kinase [Haloarcula]|uniref:Uridylate kinase n=1 Tax=Haloarcula pellucida TaxID=1427151 RepID=A0A830GJY4_9EURY|nr:MULTISPECIES: UMP kinase [Halomicroarcula]MBX0348817.1 UMP kinase [Halomicroarcula pellucida]MDS0278580.1 UMP kinase [Halomicroarcula sp. S1AR25-4]GGN91681.1 uridylate kinase [Halomicroarcula pellucida]
MKTVVSIGGSVLVPDLDADRVAAYADVVESLAAADQTLGVVVGGGPVARQYIGAARSLGANEGELDQLGIDTTRLNARLLLSALDGDIAAPTIPTDYEEAATTLHRDAVAVMGGVVPGQTTDAVAAALAEYVDADRLVFATSVPGVFDADPNEDPDAERYDEIRASDLVELVARGESLGAAGSNAPIDLLATKVLKRSSITAAVVDGSDPTAVERAVLDDDYDGTTILPDDD